MLLECSFAQQASFQDVKHAAGGTFLNSVVVEAPIVALPAAQPKAAARATSIPVPVVLIALTAFAAIIQGYHPYADDAGIYIAGVKLALHPYLYGSSSVFITGYTHLSIFSSLIAAMVRMTHLPLLYVLFGIQLFTTWLVLYSCWKLALKCFSSPQARWGAVTLVAVCLTMPVAGSALFIMDPYVTSRSFSTPLTLLAIGAALDRRFLKVFLWLVAVGLLHPLMAIYAAGFLLLLWMMQEERWLTVSALCAMSIFAGAVLQFSQRNVVESAAYRTAALTRAYFYLYSWKWYELFGLVAPLALMFAYCWWQRFNFRKSSVALCGTCIAIGMSSIIVSLLFSHPESHSHLVARLQTIRSFLIIYIILFMGLGGLVTQYLLKGFVWRWALVFLGIASIMFVAQRRDYPASAHSELPWVHSSNSWSQAFIWIRKNTPANAVFALDANYIGAKGEDTQGFRAMAERSSLADYSKDGGTAAAFPLVAKKWMVEHTADTNLNRISDQERIRRLAPLGVSWLVLQKNADTQFVCPFHNAVVKVCQLPKYASK